VEGLAISTGLVKTYPKNLLKDDQRNLVLTPLMRVILRQQNSVADLINMLAALETSESIAAIITDLKALQSSYQLLNIEEKIKNNRSDLVLTDKNLVDITFVVEKLRKDITN